MLGILMQAGWKYGFTVVAKSAQLYRNSPEKNESVTVSQAFVIQGERSDVI